MVLPPSTAAQGEATEVGWLTEIRRWLTLGHKGVIILIRDAQRARLRELVLMLEEIEPGFCFTDDPAEIAAVGPGRLMLLTLRHETLDWLNLNRPLFADRSLRAVLWAEGELSVSLKFLAPDLHDWISHFVSCPVGVPEFAVAGLAQGIRWSPGVTWTGLGLDLARARVSELDDCLELDPSRDYSELVEALQRDTKRCIIWRNIQTSTQLWRARWALAESHHTAPSILDNPQIDTPGWYHVCADQLDLREVTSLVAGIDRLRAAALVELEPNALSSNEPSIEDIGLLRTTGPALRRLHESQAVSEWRLGLVRRMRTNPSEDWTVHEMAAFASLERNRLVWPNWSWSSWSNFLIEHYLRVGADTQTKGKIALTMAWIGHHDIVLHWHKQWNLDVEALMSTTVASAQGRRLDTPPIVLIDEPETHLHPEFSGGLHTEKAEQVITLGEILSWDMPLVWRLLVLQTAIASTTLPEFLDRVATLAAQQLGHTDPQFYFILRLLGLAAGASGNPTLAHSYLSEPARVASDGRYQRLAGADLELSVVLTMLGRYRGALAQFGRASSTDPDYGMFEQFHRLTRAALGQTHLENVAQQPLSTQVETEGRTLLRSRLRQLGNVILREP